MRRRRSAPTATRSATGRFSTARGSCRSTPNPGSWSSSDLGAETEQCLRNLAAVCRAAGTELGKAIRATIYTTKLDRFDEINAAYGGFFGGEPPARVAVGVAALPKGARIEIEAMVAIE